MVIRCERDENYLVAIGEVFRGEVPIQFSPFFRSNPTTPEKDAGLSSANPHGAGWRVMDFNAAHDGGRLLDFSGIHIPWRTIVVCPERIF